MYCSKCGAQNDDENDFCSKCGNKLKETGNVQKSKNNAGKEKLFSGHLLNIIAVSLIALVVIMSYIPDFSAKESNNKTPNTGIHVTVQPPKLENHYSNHIINPGNMCISVFLIGLLTYFIHSSKWKLILACVYLLAAIADLMYVVVMAIPVEFVIFTCGLGALVYIPYILQVVAGVKFVTGAKEYKAYAK